MYSPQISVIVPIYRADGTLLRCLDSLKAQTFRDFEVFPEGMTDGHLKLCVTEAIPITIILQKQSCPHRVQPALVC